MGEVKRPTRDDSRELGRGHTTMERRKFVVGLGALASGSAAAVGTGAFSSVEADRSVSVETGGDNDAYLGLEAERDDIISDDGDGQLSLDLGSQTTTEGGEGFNEEAVTEIDGVFRITNQGTQEVGAGFYNGEGNFASERNVVAEINPIDGVTLEVQGAEEFDVNPDTGDSSDGAVLDPGDSALVDVTVDTLNEDPEDVSSGSVTIAAYETGGI